MSSYTIGLDIGGTHIRIGLRESAGMTEHFEKTARDLILNGRDSVDSLARFIMEYVWKYKGGNMPENIVFGFPATLDAARRTVLQAPNIPGIDNLSADALEKKLGIKVYFEKDVNLLLLCDMEDLGLPDEGITAGIYIGTGIGNAIFLNGVPLVGKNGAAGELGHIPRGENSKRCGCGNFGCAECFGSGLRLQEIRRESFPDTPLNELFVRHWEDPILQRFLDESACTVAAEVNILDPDWLVLGGGVLNMDGFPFAAFQEKILLHTRKPYPAANLRILRSKDGVENGVRGALQLGWLKLSERGAKDGN